MNLFFYKTSGNKININIVKKQINFDLHKMKNKTKQNKTKRIKRN